MANLYQLQTGETVSLTVIAREKWSSEKILTAKGQRYRIWCDDKQVWTDWFIKTTPEGFFNLLAYIAGLRVKGVKCFCLCGGYDQKDSTAFAIGRHREIAAETGELSFFPNDTAGAYSNNKGSIIVTILRLS